MGQLLLDFFRQVATEEGINRVKSCHLHQELFVVCLDGRFEYWEANCWVLPFLAQEFIHDEFMFHRVYEVLTSSLSVCSDRVLAAEASTLGNTLRSRYILTACTVCWM